MKARSYDENFFAVQYRKEIVEEIMKYWDKLILSISAIEPNR